MTGFDASPSAEAVLAAADQAFDRVMTEVSDRPSALPPDLEPADALRWVTDRVTEAVAGLAELPLHRLLDLQAPDGAAEDAGPAAASGEPVRMATAAGAVGQARIWVHGVGGGSTSGVPSASASALPGARLTFELTELRGSGADPLPADGGRFEPPSIDLPAAPGISTLLRYQVPAEAEPGEYHGRIVGRGVAGATVPVTVVVG